MGATGVAEDFLGILRANHGFDEPEKWLGFAKRENFKLVKAWSIRGCPDCGASSDKVLGQYVHYSTLMRLRECDCGLIWSDAALDPKVIAEHFENTYKDETYFQRQRGKIFAQLVELIDYMTPQGGSVIDIGGGKGHLMHEVRRVRPDLAVSVVDVSHGSTEHCRREFGIEATTGSLSQVRGRYQTAVLSDVLYYEDDMRAAWDVIARVANTVIIRGPNKLDWIRKAQVNDPMQSAIKHFNPEHRFILSRQYIERSLRKRHFSSIRTIPTPPLMPVSPVKAAFSSLVDRYANVMYALTREIRSPSMVTIAWRK